MEKEEISFEEALEKLTNSVNKLSSGEVKLDEAFKLFEDGIKYAKICEDKLNNVEEKVAKIVKDGHLEDFKIGE